MRKNVAIINDELGTIALGFSKAGYDIRAIYIDTSNANSVQVCKDNWGDIVRDINIDNFDKQNQSMLVDTDFIAGRIRFSRNITETKHENIGEDRNVLQVIHILRENKPTYFLFQCNKVINKDFFYKFCDSIAELGYVINYEGFDTRLITGFPVNEKAYFIYGSLGSRSIMLESLKNVDTLNYTLDYFCEKPFVDDWYYQISPRILQRIERKNDNVVLCWDKNNYKETKLISWNPWMIPLIVYKDVVRKMTPREIARLKGIPEEYYFSIKNKAWLCRSLMYCSNVLLIQQVVSAISMDTGDKYFQRRAISKGVQFEKIVRSYFRQKGIDDAKSDKDINIDFQVQTDEGNYFFDLKIYVNNYGIEDKLIAACERIYDRERLSDTYYILIIGNIISTEMKKKIEDKFQIYIWDVENLLWLFEEFPQIKSDFISLLSFSVSETIPKKPAPYIFEQYPQTLTKIDLQEKLRKIQPGKENSHEYEKLCEEIMRYLFSENLEFFDSQRQSNDGLYRFDYCGKIKHGNSSEFFDTIQKFFCTKYIIFEFKNYTDQITQKEIYTTEKYLYEKALRKVAVIVSRKGADENANKAARGSLREAGKLIICLSDENINKLIDMKNNLGDPGDFLEVLLDDMLMDLEK